MVHQDENVVESTNTGILGGLINKVTTGISGTKSSGTSTTYGTGTTQSSTTPYGSSTPTTTTSTDTAAYGSDKPTTTTITSTGAYGSDKPTTSTGTGAYGSTTPSTSTGTGAYGSTTPSTSTGTGAYGSAPQGYTNGDGVLRGFISGFINKGDEGKDKGKPTGYGSDTTTGVSGTYTSGVDTPKGDDKPGKDAYPKGYGYDGPAAGAYTSGPDTKSYGNDEGGLGGFISGLIHKGDNGKGYGKSITSTGYGSETATGGTGAYTSGTGTYTSNTGTGVYTSGADHPKGDDKSEKDSYPKGYGSGSPTYSSDTDTKGYDNGEGGLQGFFSGLLRKDGSGGYAKSDQESIDGITKPEEEMSNGYGKDSTPKTSGYDKTTTTGAYGTGTVPTTTTSYGSGTALGKGTKGNDKPEKKSTGAYGTTSTGTTTGAYGTTGTDTTTGAYTTGNSNGYTVTSAYAKMLAATTGQVHNEVARQVVTNDVVSEPEAHTAMAVQRQRQLEGNDQPRQLRWLQTESAHDSRALREGNMSLIGTNANDLQFLAGGAMLLVAGVVLGVTKRLKNRSNSNKLKAQEQDIYSLME